MIKKAGVVTVVIFLVCVSIGIGQTPFTLTLSQSAPEVGLFFSNPSYISPALGYGTYGIFSNPAALGYSTNYGLNFLFGIPSKPEIDLTARVLDADSTHGQLNLPLAITMKDVGGFNFLGFSKKLGPVGLGIGYMQRQSMGIGLDFDQTETLNLSYQIVQPIRANIAPGVDTSIRLTWNITGPIALRAVGSGEADFGKTPLFVGGGFASGPVSVGIGCKLSKYSGNLGVNANFVGNAIMSAIGIPSSPFKGQLTGLAALSDSFISVNGSGDFSANRISFILGTMLRAGFFKMGLTVEQGLKTNLAGNYNLHLLAISGDPPDSVHVDSNFVHFVYPDSIYGRARLTVAKQPKSGDTLGGTSTISLPGYTAVNFGISLSVFDLYAGLTIPKKGEINSGSVGILFSIPVSMVTVRAGLLASADYLYFTDDQGNNQFVPIRAPIYFGVGGTVKTKFNFIPYAPNAQIDFGIRTNAVPWLATPLSNLIDQISNVQAPSAFSLLGFNLGLSLNI
jgi:hypothetical protein